MSGTAVKMPEKWLKPGFNLTPKRLSVPPRRLLQRHLPGCSFSTLYKWSSLSKFERGSALLSSFKPSGQGKNAHSVAEFQSSGPSDNSRS